MSETGDYDPEIYDLLQPASLGGDLEWYRRLAERTGGPILELGAGTGRIVLPLARAGLEIHALDRDPKMLATLRRKLDGEPDEVRQRVTVIEGDMQSFTLPHRYRLIQIPFRAFLYCLGREAQLDCLSCCHQHLVSGGLLALNVFHPSLEYMGRSSGYLEGVWRWTRDLAHPAGGRVVCSECNKYDTAGQRVFSKLRFEHFSDEGSLLSTHLMSLELAYLHPGDLRELLGEAGFTEVRIDGDFEDRPLAHDGDELAVRATKP